MNIETRFITILFYFFIFGAVIAFCYEALRIIRVVIKHNNVAVGIEDILFLTLTGPLIFGFSMEVGNGEFRFLYLASAAFGALVYFFTAGMLFKAIYTPVIRFAKRIVKIPIQWIGKLAVFIAQKISRIFVAVYKKSTAYMKNKTARLKSHRKIKYNKNDTKEERNDDFGRTGRIKAKIDKQ